MDKKFRILVATDYSNAAINAERYAFAFARDTHSFFEVLHVFDTAMESESSFSEEHRRLRHHAGKILHRLPGKGRDVDYACLVNRGEHAGEQIVKEAEVSDIDFMVVGTHSENHLLDTFTENTTWEIVKNAAIPVLIVPEKARYEGIKHLLFASECRTGEIPAIRIVAQFASLFGAKLTVLHVNRNHALKKVEQFANVVEEQVLYPALKVELFNAANTIGGLRVYCEKEGVDWLVMLPKKLSFSEGMLYPGSTNTTKRMSLHTHIPVFVIPEFS